LTGFNEVAANTNIELYFPNIRNPATATYYQKVKVSVYQVDYLSQTTWLYYRSTPTSGLIDVEASWT
jgi:hypothetical protein